MDAYQQKIINLTMIEHSKIQESDVYYLAMSQLLFFETLKLAKEGKILINESHVISKTINYKGESFIIEKVHDNISLYNFFVTNLELSIIDDYYQWFLDQHSTIKVDTSHDELKNISKQTLEEFLEEEHLTSLAYALLILDNKKSSAFITNSALLEAAKSITKLSRQTFLYDLLIQNRRQIHFKLHKKEKFSLKQALNIFAKK